MKVYREQLFDAVDPKDRYDIRCWPKKGQAIEAGNRFQRVAGKYLAYRMRVMAGPKTEIVHLLDHSSSYLIPAISKKAKVVVTLHDLIPLRFGADLTKGQIERFRSSVSHLERCDAIVSVSEYSKQEAIELLGIPSEQIHVVPNGVNPPECSGDRCEHVERLRRQGAELVVLSVGSTQKRKNLEILPESLRVLAKETGKKAALLRVGGAVDGSLAAKMKEVCGEELFVEAGRLDEGQLWNAYASCDLVIVPSFYEGFGLPVIEALSCGKGVAASSWSSLPEVGGAHAEYFDPQSGEEAGKALAQLAQQVGDRGVSLKRQKAVEELTWRKHLEGVFTVYDGILNS